MTTQAPRIAPSGLNLVMAMMMSTISERTAPVALMNRPRRQPGSLSLMWCLAIPAWESVKLVNTPMAYSGMRRSTLAWVMTTRNIEAAARAMMPLENTRRCPRLVS